jgi:hypothetical protein
VNNFERFAGTPGASWNASVAGSVAGLCAEPVVYQGCYVELSVKLVNGTIKNNEGMAYILTSSFAVNISGSDNLTEVESIRARVAGAYGASYSAWVVVPDHYPSPRISMRVNSTTYASNGTAWDVSLNARNFYLADGPCTSLAYTYCSYGMQGKRADETTVSLGYGYVGGDPLEVQNRHGWIPGSVKAIRTFVGGAGGNIYSSWIPVSSRVQDGRDTATAEAAFLATIARLGPQGACAQLAMYPGTHAANSTVNDQSLACTAGVQAGLSGAQIFAALVQQFGSAIGVMMTVSELVGQPPASTTQGTVWEWPTWPYNNPGTETEPAPTRPLLAPPVLDPTWEAILTDSLVERGMITSYGFDPVPTRQHAQEVARQCILIAVLTGLNDERCLDTNIFVPGSDVFEAAQHDWDAIITGMPALLSYRSGAERVASGVSPGWYVAQGCQGSSSASPKTACDEYPFYASQQGGTSSSASLRVINAEQNSREGGLWYGVAAVCGAAPPSSPNREILVVPMPIQGGPVSSGWCSGS